MQFQRFYRPERLISNNSTSLHNSINDFLRYASDNSLQNLELASHNRASNLSKSIRIELDSWVEQRATAMLARWALENRRSQ